MTYQYLSEQTMLPKDNMAGDAKAMSNRIITSIFFLSFAITKEATKARTRLEFVVFMRLKKDKTGRAKGSEMLIVRWRSKKTLIRSLIKNCWAWNMIDGMGNSENSFSPKGYRNFGRQKENTNSVKDVSKFSFGSSVLLRGRIDEQFHGNIEYVQMHVG
jgi:hypothetical protein